MKKKRVNKFRFAKNQKRKSDRPNKAVFRNPYRINEVLGLRHAFIYCWVEPHSTVHEMETMTLLPRELISVILGSLATHGWLVYHDGILGGSYSKAPFV